MAISDTGKSLTHGAGRLGTSRRTWSMQRSYRLRSGLTLGTAAATFVIVAISAQHIGAYCLDQRLPVVIVLIPGAISALAAALVVTGAARSFFRAIAAVRISDTRTSRALGEAASVGAWNALSWSGALLVVTASIWFMVVNNGAVSRTFLDLSLILSSARHVVLAFGTNIEIFVVGCILMLIWALVVAVARTLPGRVGKPLRFLAIVYCDLFRGLPAIICIYLVGFGLPLTNLPIISNLSSATYAIIALTLTYGAYTSEIYRAGIESVHQSQINSARSLGLGYLATLRYVVVPLAVRTIIPPLLNNCISLQKDTALVAIIGTIDAFNQSKIIAANNFNLSAVTTVAILFIVITIPQARLVDRLSERDRRRMRAGG